MAQIKYNLGDLGKEKYSRDEIVIGEWIDGKPIYQKTFEVVFNYSDSDSNYRKLTGLAGKINSQDAKFPMYLLDYSLSDLKIDKFLKFFGIVDNTIVALVPTFSHTFGYTTGWYDSSTSKLAIVVGEQFKTSTKLIITVKYTKTTD